MRTIIKIGFSTFLVPPGADVGKLVSLLSRSVVVTEDVGRGLVNDEWHYQVGTNAPRIEVLSMQEARLHKPAESSISALLERRLIGQAQAIATASVAGR